MRSRVLVILVLIVLAGLLVYQREIARRKLKPAQPAAVKPAAAVDTTIEGKYRSQGQNPDGTAYEGTLDLQKKGEIYSIQWQAGDSQFSGTGLKEDSILAVSYFQKNKARTAIYRIRPGKLEGRWMTHGDSLFGREVCTKQ
jgi:hypothetical protein